MSDGKYYTHYNSAVFDPYRVPPNPEAVKYAEKITTKDVAVYLGNVDGTGRVKIDPADSFKETATDLSNKYFIIVTVPLKEEWEMDGKSTFEVEFTIESVIP